MKKSCSVQGTIAITNISKRRVEIVRYSHTMFEKRKKNDNHQHLIFLNRSSPSKVRSATRISPNRGRNRTDPYVHGPFGPHNGQEIRIAVRTFPVMHVILGVNTSWAEGGSSRGGRPLRLCFGGGGSSTSPSLSTVSTPGVAAPGLWPVLFRSFCAESLRQLTSARPLMCRSSAVFSNDDSLVCKKIIALVSNALRRSYTLRLTGVQLL